MPHDVFEFVCRTMLKNLKKRKLPGQHGEEGVPEEGANDGLTSKTILLLAHEIRTLYESEDMTAKGYRMAFVMLSGGHYKAILPGREEDYPYKYVKELT
eukprot:5885079-Prymnesium_polylepis.1